MVGSSSVQQKENMQQGFGLVASHPKSHCMLSSVPKPVIGMPMLYREDKMAMMVLRERE